MSEVFPTPTPTPRIHIEINTLSREGTNISDQFVTTDLSPVYSIRRADTIAVFLDALFLAVTTGRGLRRTPGSSLLHEAAALGLSREKPMIQSLASPTPSALMANIASASGRQGES